MSPRFGTSEVSTRSVVLLVHRRRRGKRPRTMKHHFISGMKVAANGLQRKSFLVPAAVLQIDPVDLPTLDAQLFQRHARSEERRVGKECVSTGRFRGWPSN